jgi:hypothetical protein
VSSTEERADNAAGRKDHAANRRTAYAVAASYVCAAALAVTAVFVSTVRTEEAVHDSERKWCALLVPLDDGYKLTPPPTESGRRFAAIIHDLRVDFGC